MSFFGEDTNLWRTANRLFSICAVSRITWQSLTTASSASRNVDSAVSDFHAAARLSTIPRSRSLLDKHRQEANSITPDNLFCAVPILFDGLSASRGIAPPTATQFSRAGLEGPFCRCASGLP